MKQLDFSGDLPRIQKKSAPAGTETLHLYPKARSLGYFDFTIR